MKFLISDVEHEVLPHESLEPVDFNGIVFERVFDAKRKLRGLGEYITEDTRKQVHVIMTPATDLDAERMEEHNGFSITGAKIAFELQEGVQIALSQLQALSGIGPFGLWIKGRRYGEYNLEQGFNSEFTEELFQIIDLEIGLSREEWFGDK